MIETKQPGRSSSMSPQTSKVRRLLAALVCVALVSGVAIASYFYARSASETEMKSANLRIVELQGEIQKLRADNTGKSVEIADLQAALKSVKAKLAAITPSENTYNVMPNQTIIVGGGRLTIGLVGAPTNESINININGRQLSALAGAVFNSAPDPSTTCQVGVQSFDMFRAVLTASCAAKP